MTPSPTVSASHQQRLASDPRASVFVTANAGSGKTHVLVNRIIRLLLGGTAPERILCLTYTRAAAAEMAGRLFDRLAGWIGLDDPALAAAIRDIAGDAEAGPETLAEARRLFARAIETPGGLKIQTIHAFCERLLHRFPVEAGVVPGFSVLDERDGAELLASCRSRVVTPTADGDHAAIASLIARVVRYISVNDLDALLNDILGKRHEIAGVLGSDQAVEAAVLRLADVLGIARDETEASITAACCRSLDRDAFRRVASVMAGSGTATDRKQAGLIGEFLSAPTDNQRFAILKAVLINKSGPKADSGLVTNRFSDANPGLRDFLREQQATLIATLDRLNAIHTRDATSALLRLVRRIMAEFEAEKTRLGQYDYDDLINKTLSLVGEAPSADWVLYRLDGGLDHILIDEAQDTSPVQWRIIERLTGDFFAGAGGRGNVVRTVFAVGDSKQSIFSFQGADPAALEEMRQFFAQRASQAGQKFETVPLQVSFRTTSEVLKLVDWVFSQPEARSGVTGAGEELIHEAVRRGEPGRIEVWPFEGPGAKPERTPWRTPDGGGDPDAPERRLADRIASQIRDWLDREEMLESQDRPLRPGDILILLRKRTRLMDALLRALKQRGIAVAGADRLHLTRSLAVQDLMTLARFCLLPADDLTLAGLLKSALLARDDGRPIDDGDLLTLAYGRGDVSLLARLEQAAAAGAPYAKAVSALHGWLAMAGFLAPNEFFARVLNSDHRRRTMIERLGGEANETIDAFLQQALDHEMTATPSLVSFLDWLEAADTQLKRDMEHGSDEVRIMTVHGAKGLEAPVVILPDTATTPDKARKPSFFPQAGDGADAPPVWRLKKAFATSLTDALCERAHARALEEHNRLLYVAMTRARDRLYVAGCGTGDGAPEGSWYALISQGLHGLAAEALPDMDFEKVFKDREVVGWRIKGTGTKRSGKTAGERARYIEPLPLPDWALRDPPPEPASPLRLKPSQPGAGKAADGGVAQAEQFASPLAGEPRHRFQRGRLIHTLLQHLPSCAPGQRRAKAAGWLAVTAAHLGEDERAGLAEEVMAVLEDTRFAPLFAPGSLAEVDVSALIADRSGRVAGLAGRIDRLAVTDDRVLIVDYKTNRPAPTSPDRVDSLYLFQLAAYARALAEVYPGLPVITALLWTDGPQLMEIPPEMLAPLV